MTSQRDNDHWKPNPFEREEWEDAAKSDPKVEQKASAAIQFPLRAQRESNELACEERLAILVGFKGVVGRSRIERSSFHSQKRAAYPFVKRFPQKTKMMATWNWVEDVIRTRTFSRKVQNDRKRDAKKSRLLKLK